MIKKIFKSALACSVIALGVLSSCYEDKGNYEYVELPEFRVDTVGVPLSYVIESAEVVNIPTNIIYNGNKEDLQCTWSLYGHAQMQGISVEVDTIAHTLDLNAPVVAEPGTYTLEFCALDPHTGLRATQLYGITIEGSVRSGLFVVYDHKDGYVDADIVRTKALISSGNDSVMYNMFTRSNPDYKLKGTAVGGDYTGSMGHYHFYLFSSEDGVRLNADNMQIVHYFDDLFVTAPGASTITKYQKVGSWECLFLNNTLQMNLVYTNSTPFFAIPRAGLEDSQLEHGINVYGGAILAYDNKNLRYMWGGMWDGTFTPAKDSDVSKVDMTNVGKKALYMDFGYAYSWIIYTVLADIDSDKRYISATNVMVQSPADYKVLNFVDVSDAENIANAKFFVAGKQGFYMFYAVDNKLYKLTCKMQESQDYSSELVMEYPAGTEITAMKGYNYGNTLVLGVYDSAAQESKLYIYNADETTGVLTEPEVNGYTIYGKIKGFGLKQW